MAPVLLLPQFFFEKLYFLIDLDEIYIVVNPFLQRRNSIRIMLMPLVLLRQANERCRLRSLTRWNTEFYR
jgi:hypothetical protein